MARSPKPRRGRPPKRAGGTRDEILRVSLDLFSSQGFAGTPVRQVASAVGIREASIYAHFASKKEILRTIFETFGPSSVSALAEQSTTFSADDPGRVLFELADAIVATLTSPDEVKFGRLMFMHMLTRGDDEILANDFMRAAGAKLADVLRQLMVEGAIRQLDPQLAAFEYIAPIALICIENVTFAGNTIDHERISRRVHNHVAFFWQAVRIDPEPAG